MQNKKVLRVFASVMLSTVLMINTQTPVYATALSSFTAGSGILASESGVEEVTVGEGGINFWGVVNNEKDKTEENTSTKETDESDASASITTTVSAGAGEMVVGSVSLDEEDNDEEETAGAAFGYTNLGVANVEDHLNVRAGADENSKIVGKMSPNAGCEILGIEGNMAHIASGSVEGYVSLDYLLTGDAAVRRAKAIIQKLATVNADGLKLREQPSTEAAVINMVPYGEELPVLDDALEGWVKVSYDEQSVYVSADYVTVDEKLKTALNMTEFLYGEGVSDVRVELCEYAKQFIGNPYVWGGTSLTKGADCSGFVLSVYAKYGISLPHSSRAQANSGTRISMSEAKPGDLVFYAKGGRINHVGIYIGGGQLVHASSPKTGIRVSNVYYRNPVAVVRLLHD